MNNDEKREDAEIKLHMAKTAEQNGQSFNALILYKQALSLFREAGPNEKVQYCLGRIRPMATEAAKTFKRVTASARISDEDLDKVLKPLKKEETIEKALAVLALHPHFHINQGIVVKFAEKQMAESIYTQITSLTVLGPKGDLVKSGTDHLNLLIAQQHDYHRAIIGQSYLPKAWVYLVEDMHLTQEDLISLFRERGILTEDQLGLLANGLASFFDGNYVAALHILVPRFEDFLIHVAENLGIQMVTLDRGKEVATRDAFGLTLLEHPEILNVFGVNFCNESKYFLLHPLGENLRNRLSHGTIKSSDCTLEKCLYLIKLLLHFPSCFRSKLVENGGTLTNR